MKEMLRMDLSLKALLAWLVLSVTEATTVGEISRQKCWEYSKHVYINEDNPVLVLSATSAESNIVSKCDIVETPLIVGGQRVNENEFPHMVNGYGPAAVGYRSDEFNETYSFKCGGSVISPLFVLTAAHCENDRESGRPIVVKMGVIHIQDNGTNAQMINIDYFASHPQYRNNEKYYDIALIKLKSFIRFDEHVRPACVSSLSKQWPKAIAIGFGKTQYVNDKGSRHLRKVLLSSVDRATCVRTYQTYKLLKNGIIDSQFCSGEEKGNKIVLSEPYCMYEIVGITSFGKFCGFASSYGVYTNVSSFVDWIEKSVWP